MSDATLLVILLIPMVLALAFGVWAGLGYPGMHGRYESTGKPPRELPVTRLLARVGRRTDRHDESESEASASTEPGEAAGGVRSRRVRLERKGHWPGAGRR